MVNVTAWGGISLSVERGSCSLEVPLMEIIQYMLEQISTEGLIHFLMFLMGQMK